MNRAQTSTSKSGIVADEVGGLLSERMTTAIIREFLWTLS